MRVSRHNDISIYFEDTGNGVPIVLGHSFLCSGKMWANQVPELDESFRTINVDFRGHGQSDPVNQPFTLEDAIEDVIAVLDHLEINKAVWCGLSVGGMVAVRAALTHPDRISGLILVDADAGAENHFRRAKYRIMGWGASVLGIKPFLPSISKSMFGKRTRANNQALVSTWMDEFSSVDIQSMLTCLTSISSRISVVDRLEEITVPTLVIVGQEDISMPPKRSDVMHAGIPGSTLVYVDGAGHLSALEQPEAVTDAILTFLKTNFN